VHVRGRSLQNLPDLDKLTKLQELLSEGCERLDCPPLCPGRTGS
jgi:hypothetical protein